MQKVTQWVWRASKLEKAVTYNDDLEQFCSPSDKYLVIQLYSDTSSVEILQLFQFLAVS